MTPDPTPPLGVAELEAIEAQATRATPGPWSEFCESGDWWIGQQDAKGGPTGLTVCDADTMSVDDMLFIVAARTNVPRLVADLQASRAREAALREALLGLADATDQVIDTIGPQLEDIHKPGVERLAATATQALALLDARATLAAAAAPSKIDAPTDERS